MNVSPRMLPRPRDRRLFVGAQAKGRKEHAESHVTYHNVHAPAGAQYRMNARALSGFGEHRYYVASTAIERRHGCREG